MIRLSQQVNVALSRGSMRTTQIILPPTISSNALHSRAAGAIGPDLFLYSRCQSAASCSRLFTDWRLEALESANSTSSRSHCSYICPTEDLPVKPSCLKALALIQEWLHTSPTHSVLLNTPVSEKGFCYWTGVMWLLKDNNDTAFLQIGITTVKTGILTTYAVELKLVRLMFKFNNFTFYI